MDYRDYVINEGIAINTINTINIPKKIKDVPITLSIIDNEYLPNGEYKIKDYNKNEMKLEEYNYQLNKLMLALICMTTGANVDVGYYIQENGLFKIVEKAY